MRAVCCGDLSSRGRALRSCNFLTKTMNALRRPLPAATLNLARTVGITVPFALIGHYLGGIHGVFKHLDDQIVGGTLMSHPEGGNDE